jgi:hypothetical protein
VFRTGLGLCKSLLIESLKSQLHRLQCIP